MLSHSDIFLEHLYPKVSGFMFITRIKTSEPRMEESGNSLFAIMKLQNHSCLQIFSPSCVASVLLVSLYLYISIVRVELFCVKGLKWWPCVVPCLDTGQCTMSPKGITLALSVTFSPESVQIVLTFHIDCTKLKTTRLGSSWPGPKCTLGRNRDDLKLLAYVRSLRTHSLEPLSCLDILKRSGRAI